MYTEYIEVKGIEFINGKRFCTLIYIGYGNTMIANNMTNEWLRKHSKAYTIVSSF